MRSPSRFHLSPRKIEAITLKLSGMTYKQIAAVMGFTPQRAMLLVMPNRTVKEDVRRKYNGRCADCCLYIPVYPEITDGTMRAHVHHDKITETPEQYNNITNLVYLCNSCHAKRHHPQCAKFGACLPSSTK